jgi:hypothetical protein
MVREGLLTSAEAETHPRRNVLQRSMGVAEEVEIDVRGPIDLREGDTFILCSDGLHGVVKEPELQEIAALSIEEAADEFMRRALERGAPDNVTVIVARVEETDEPEPQGLYVAALDTDETITDRFEDTQPLEPLDESQFDETVRDTDKVLVAPVEDTAEVPVPRRDAKPQSSVVKWTVVLAIVIGGAAGAWLYWNHQQAAAPEARPAASPAR